jgi:hypothetical protein
VAAYYSVGLERSGSAPFTVALYRRPLPSPFTVALHRAQHFFEAHEITVDAVLTDNARNYIGKDFTAALGNIDHRRI